MKTSPIRKGSNFPEHARINIYRGPGRAQVEIGYSTRFGSRGEYSNAPKRFIDADVRYIDGRWCWVIDDDEGREEISTEIDETIVDAHT